MEKGKWYALAPPAMLITIIGALRSYALIVLYFAYRTYQRFDSLSFFNSFDLFLDFLISILPAFLVVVVGIMEYRRFRYQLGEEQLHTKSGWLRREKKSIPIEKIQSVQIEQNWLYQLLNVYLVKVDTIGDDKLEVEIGGVWEEDAINLKSQIQSIKKESSDQQTGISEPGSVPDIQFEYNLTNRQISRYAVTENFLWFLLPSTLSIILLYQLYHSVDAEQLTWQLLFDMVVGNLDPTGSALEYEDFSGNYFILYGLLLATFSSGMYLFNKVFGLFNYNLTFQNQEIHIRRGLINKFETIIPRRKIQLTTWYTNFIRKKLGIFTLSYKYAGGRKTLGADAIVPFFDENIIIQLNQPYYQLNFQSEPISISIHPAYVWRNFLWVKIPLSLIIITLCFWIHTWIFYLALGLPVYFLVYNIFYRRNFKLHLYKDYFLVQQGVWGRRTTLVKWNKLQKSELRQTPFQRRKKLANLHLHTAASNVTIPYLDQNISEQINDYGLYSTESSKVFLF